MKTSDKYIIKGQSLVALGRACDKYDLDDECASRILEILEGAIERYAESKPAKPSRYGISRVKDGDPKACWYVRLFYQGGKPKHQKTFTDNAYGGKEKSLKAACDWRNGHVNPRLMRFTYGFWYSREERHEIQRMVGKPKITFWPGKESALEAAVLGVIRTIVNKISVSDTETTVLFCHALTKYEVDGFTNEVDDETADFVYQIASSRCPHWMSDEEVGNVVNATLLAYASTKMNGDKTAFLIGTVRNVIKTETSRRYRDMPKYVSNLDLEVASG